MSRKKTFALFLFALCFLGLLEGAVVARPSPSRVIVISSTEVAAYISVDSHGIYSMTGPCVAPNWCMPPPWEIAKPQGATVIWADSDGTVHVSGPCVEPEWCTPVDVVQPLAWWFLIFYTVRELIVRNPS